MVADAKAQGARRKPPRPAAPTAAELREATPTNGESGVEANVAAVQQGLEDAQAFAVEHSHPESLDVIRLVSGNPLNRASIKAEISAVAAAGLEFQVVPGMSLPSTVPSFAGLALGST